ncbi:TPA: DeoR/GlpR transcriptional regulator [Streptococcus suis]|uniref:Lactose phosphotransferase system repressor n=1 Tax=Streptococcus suis TaxID=1307 RepID=A0A0M9FHU4_STRSU|nr:hypothetical protein A7J09_06415 [Streptococcus suis]KPA67572.1 hypothetical protein XK26_05110 [Streptococcus suis]MCB2852637.1 DeoR/GlpR transcriptional regulator [Streptococcus suis]MCB2858607.1 DeoR/GlpR transcriptional regulator [Streptococcus suis]MCB2864858.1 DeoR/GlpR transcriptional regulator [Streptococcus suis]
MSRDKRLKEITDILHTKKRIDVKQLEKLTFSSISTLRRDLIYLEEQGFLTRKRGEVVLNSFNTVELAHSIRETENRDAKKKLQNLPRTLSVLVCAFTWTLVQLFMNFVPI